MAAAKRKTEETDPVVEKLGNGHYNRELARWQAQIDDAAAVLRRAYAAMKAENTLAS
ncbi:hypothetical protein [Phenylobacterium sp.]|uniref:hypothetical protein n=1 Tax=Phenylobacterium sp. TaxID=1871053 RepID=UPI0025D31BD8|nr:hypothetical protein [Phenylobacterium sp.]MBX3481903.1 hypothetical protein [Phenylobacterium sp.]MCW5758744.1 hypothetical protein [Phenylobacterium sp.]